MGKIMVTGAGGFLGSHISMYFNKCGYDVTGVGRCDQNQNLNIEKCNIIKFVNMELPKNEFEYLVRKVQPELIIHCAGSSSVAHSFENPHSDFYNSVTLCEFILKTIRNEAPECSFVFISSAAVYGNPKVLPITEKDSISPISPYGYHKLLCEQLIEEHQKLYGIKAYVLRVFSAYGEGLLKQVIYDLCVKFSDPDIEMINLFGTGSESRDFIHAYDIARAIKCIYESNQCGIYNIASGIETPIAEVAALVKNALNSSKPIAFSGIIKVGDPSRWCADISKIKALGFIPNKVLHKEIPQYCKWFKGLDCAYYRKEDYNG